MQSHKRLSPLNIIVMTVAVVCIAFASYTGVYHHAGTAAKQACVSDGSVSVENHIGSLSFGDPSTAKAGFILYPGAKVQAAAYAPLARDIAARGYYVVIVDPPFNLALFDPDAAQKVIDSTSQVSTWFIGGHSLGGVVMSFWAAENYQEAAGLVFIASYPFRDLSGTALPVLSIRASEDLVLNIDQYEAAQAKLPSGVDETVIEGGNHAGFGDYGTQDGDGKAAIGQQEQWKQTADAIVAFMERRGRG